MKKKKVHESGSAEANPPSRCFSRCISDFGLGIVQPHCLLEQPNYSIVAEVMAEFASKRLMYFLFYMLQPDHIAVSIHSRCDRNP